MGSGIAGGLGESVVVEVRGYRNADMNTNKICYNIPGMKYKNGAGRPTTIGGACRKAEIERSAIGFLRARHRFSRFGREVRRGKTGLLGRGWGTMDAGTEFQERLSSCWKHGRVQQQQSTCPSHWQRKETRCVELERQGGVKIREP